MTREELIKSGAVPVKRKTREELMAEGATAKKPAATVANDGLGIFSRQAEAVPEPPPEKSWWRKAGEAALMGAGEIVQDVGEGALKGALSTVRGVETLGTKLGQKASDVILGKDEQREKKAKEIMEQGTITEEETKPVGTAQKVGYGMEQFAEVLVPVGKAFLPAKGAKLIQGATSADTISKAIKTAGVSEKVASMAGSVISSALEIGGKAVAEGTEFGAKRAAQTGDIEKGIKEGKTAAVWSAALGTAIKAGSSLNKTIRKMTEEANLKLTPAQKSNYSSRIDEATTYLSENPLTTVGSGEARLSAINERVGLMEQSFSDAIKARPGATNPVIGVSSVVKDMEKVAEQYRGTSYYDDAIKQVEKQKNNLIMSYGEGGMMNLEQANKYKRSLWDKAYNEAGLKVVDDINHDIGSMVKTKIEDVASKEGLSVGGKPYEEFMKEYGKVLNARKFVKVASGKSDVGLAMKLLLSGTGMATAGPIGMFAGSVAQATSSATRLRSAIVSGLKVLDDTASPDTVNAVIKAVIMSQSEE